VGLTLLTRQLGVRFHGYGYAGAVYVTALAGLVVLSRKLMPQP
jgi:polysaccharide biosynthesis protein PelG